jgi:hypothetical protein
MIRVNRGCTGRWSVRERPPLRGLMARAVGLIAGAFGFVVGSDGVTPASMLRSGPGAVEPVTDVP